MRQHLKVRSGCTSIFGFNADDVRMVNVGIHNAHQEKSSPRATRPLHPRRIGPSTWRGIQHAMYALWIVRDDFEVGPGGLIGLCSSLFPIAQHPTRIQAPCYYGYPVPAISAPVLDPEHAALRNAERQIGVAVSV